MEFLQKKKAQATTLTDIEALVYPTTNKRAPTPFDVSVLTYLSRCLKNYQFSMWDLKQKHFKIFSIFSITKILK